MWTTDTFQQNLARFSVFKGQRQLRPTAFGIGIKQSALTQWPSARTHCRRGREGERQRDFEGGFCNYL